MGAWLRSVFGRRPFWHDPVPPEWRAAVETALDQMGRKYSLDAVKKDWQGQNKRFPSFKQEFFDIVRRNLK